MTQTIHRKSNHTPTDVRRMREMREDGFTIAEISARYDLPEPTVSKLVKGVEIK